MKFYLACIQKLSELVQETSGTENKFLACPSLRVYESSDFDFLTATTPKPEDYISSENVSMQFNSLSTSSRYWDVDATSSLFDLFKERLEQLKLKERDDLSRDNQNAEKILHQKDGSPSQALLNYTDALNEYENILEQHADFLSTINMEASEQEQLVNTRRWDVLQKQLSLFIANWKLKGSKEEIEEALNKLNKLTDYDAFLALKNTIESRLKEGETTGVKSLVEFSKVNIFPNDFNKSDLSWSTLEITHSEVNAIFKRAQIALKGFNEDILNFDYDEDFIDRLSASYCIITVKRSWLHKTLFESEFVITDQTTKEYTFAKKILLIKDVRVILKEDLTAKEKAEIDGNSIIKFGPIFMKNQVFTNALSAKSFIKPITSKAIYAKAYAPKIDNKIAQISQNLVLSKPKNSKSTLKTTKNKVPLKGKTVRPVAHIKPQMLNIDPKFVKLTQTEKTHPKQELKSIKLSNKMLTSKTLDLKSLMIYNIPQQPAVKTSRVHFVIEDHLGDHPLARVEISIKDQRSSYFKEVESADNGQISILLAESNYEVTLRKNGFKEMTFLQSVKEDANVTILKQLEPQEVVYDSYFLVGIIGDQIRI